MRIMNIFFFFIFLLCAALQYNDPDPWLWIPIYLYAAFLCMLMVLKKNYPVLYIAGLVFYAAYALLLLFDKQGVFNWITQHHAENIIQEMDPAKPWIEETREFLGLLIVIVVLVINLVWLKRKRSIPVTRQN
jgi:Transmembrane family 220, helix